MKVEFDALEENRTWDVDTLPHGKNVVGSKWVHKIKYNEDGIQRGVNLSWLLRVIHNKKD